MQRAFSWINALSTRRPPLLHGADRPLRAELFSLEQLQRHARKLAAEDRVTYGRAQTPLLSRLVENEAVIRAFNASSAEVEKTRRITPAAEWLLDNFYLIREHAGLARRHLPARYHRELPRLTAGPLAGFPRVYDLMLELIAHVDGRIDITHLSGFIAAYQSVQKLKLGELWAIPIMLRIGLIENLRRVAAELAEARKDRTLAAAWADKLLQSTEHSPTELFATVSELMKSNLPPTPAFVAEFCRRLQGQSSALQFARQWLEQHLAQQGFSLDQLTQQDSAFQAAHQVTAANSISSLRFLAAINWREFVETTSEVEQLLRSDPLGVYGNLDFHTRDRYRHVVERISKQSPLSESDVARKALELSRNSPRTGDRRKRHVGFYLIDAGLPELESAAGVRLPAMERVRRFVRRHALTCHLGLISAITLALTGWTAALAYEAGLTGLFLAFVALLLLLGTSQLAVSLTNWFMMMLMVPRHLARMDLSGGVTPRHRTLVAVPTMLSSVEAIDHLIDSLEVHFLGNRDPDIFFALLTDFTDAPAEVMPRDELLLQHAREAIHALNEKYRSDRPPPFLLLHRPRQWNPREGRWMGYERKRGKLADLNALLREGRTDRFAEILGETSVLPGVNYVITLDSDIQLPRDSARQLIETMAHPLNRPRYDARAGRVTEGYAILQPRVAVSLPCARRSWFARLYASDTGIDPYTRVVSDLYQDLFSEGSFIGKGIYDVDVFHQAVGNRFPENRILSHDLLESCHARCAVVTDILLYEDHPSRYTADVSRRRRWIRGDWQIAAWLLPRVPGPDGKRVENPLSALSKWKLFDNLRRSVVPIALTLLLLLSWLLFPAVFWTAWIGILLVLPILLTGLLDVARTPTKLPWEVELRHGWESMGKQTAQALFSLATLPFDAYISFNAILRTAVRLLITKRHLLEWQTASEAERNERITLPAFLRAMWIAPALVVATAVALAIVRPENLPIAAPVLFLWVLSPLAAWWISQPRKEARRELDSEQIFFLRKLARKTWRFFETFVGPEDNWLPPDNFQEEPGAVIASRTSPTNMGMALLSTLSASDLGYLSAGQMLERLEHSFHSMDQLERYHGHFYNWYDTRTLKPLLPLYISSVDSGNLAGHLLTLQTGLLEVPEQSILGSRLREGLQDTWNVLREKFQGNLPRRPHSLGERFSRAQTLLDQMPRRFESLPGMPREIARWLHDMAADADDLARLFESEDASELAWWSGALERAARDFLRELELFTPWVDMSPPPEGLLKAAALEDARRLNEVRELLRLLDHVPTLEEVARFTHSLLPVIGVVVGIDEFRQASPERAWLCELEQRVSAASEQARRRIGRIQSLAARCEDFACMDFRFLYDRARDLFSIGYNASDNRLDASFYDLLASEARLASYVAIAQGQVRMHHWFALGRLVTSTKGRPTLISWSGSMFEYLMPLLVMPSYRGTLLDATCHAAVERQIEYGRKRGVPWGVSESGYHFTDAHLNYQYRAFGVPGLGLKRGLSEDLVIAPYASAMALLVDPVPAVENLQRLSREGAEGKFGHYEAIDYTPARVPPGQLNAIVRSYMAHHHGMSFVSMTGTLLGYPLQRRFEDNPLFKSAILLLQEKVPRLIEPFVPNELEVIERPKSPDKPPETLRVSTNPNAPSPEVHLLSNGRYHVAFSAAGGGYSHWKELALTRWREDPARNAWGSFCYFRDLDSGEVWSASFQPTLRVTKVYEAIFSQARAEVRRRFDQIDSHLEISVSPEDDLELRRVTLTNRSRRPRRIEITTYAEVVLAKPAADAAHPAFSNLFVQTRLLPERHAILCTRRPRSKDEKVPWMFHLMLLQGTETGTASFETDRAKFIGRTRTLAAPRALAERGLLSNSEGSVLDPIVAIRRTVALEPDQSAQLDVLTGIADTQEAAAALIEKYHDPQFPDRAFEMAWTQSQLALRQLNITEAEAQLYSRLAGSLLYTNPARRAPSDILAKNTRGQSTLWAYGISGDLPIGLVIVRDASRLDLARRMVQAHAYWRRKGLDVDLVIVSEDLSVYRQSIHEQIVGMIVATPEGEMLDKPGGIFVRRLEQFPPEDRVLLQAVARITIADDRGTFEEQVKRRPTVSPAIPQLIPARGGPGKFPEIALPRRNIIFDNGKGGFSPDGSEYIVTVQPGEATPAPWCNVLANERFGTIVSESGSAYSWAENCHQFRLTPWHNDPVSDTSGEAFYLRDEQTGVIWSPTPLPARGATPYLVRHGFGYSIFEHIEHGIRTELTLFVAQRAPVKFCLLKVRNVSGAPRRLSATAYWEWVLGELRPKNAMHVVTELDPETGALLARNPYNTDFAERVAFAHVNHPKRMFTADRAEFLGMNGTLGAPAALRRVRLSGKSGAGLDPCAALQAPFELAAGQEIELSFIIGAGREHGEAIQLIRACRGVEAAETALETVRQYWKQTLGAVQVETPEPAFNVLINGWLVYQALACRIWARTGFYQSGGAYGFRDQLQDSMALVHAEPRIVREHLLRAASRQFREGDVQHWWHPPIGRGVRTHFSDDYLWLPYTTCRYVNSTGDHAVLQEVIPFLEGRPVKPDEESYYDLPERSQETGTLYEHCVRAIRNGLRFGEHGLPLIGCGDWNDGMNLIGEHGRGESVWLAFFLYDVLKQFAEVARGRNDVAFAEECTAQAARLRENIELHAWDGEWYRRAYFDNGEPLGSKENPECQIDALPQSWAVLSKAGDPERARLGMEAVDHRLVRRDARLIQLFDPPFDKSSLNPGYIKGYVPGVRENGGQYTHAAVWTAMAFALMGDHQRAWELFDLINPILHGRTPEEIAVYKVEPYVIAADVYGVAPHVGRGGWTWYTGSAGWMYRLATEGLLGLRVENGFLTITPCMHPAWSTYKLQYRFGATPYEITVRRTDKISQPVTLLNGHTVENGIIRLIDDGHPRSIEHLHPWTDSAKPG
jgi:cyclic beta-1,2-glucan synthetase